MGRRIFFFRHIHTSGIEANCFDYHITFNRACGHGDNMAQSVQCMQIAHSSSGKRILRICIKMNGGSGSSSSQRTKSKWWVAEGKTRVRRNFFFHLLWFYKYCFLLVTQKNNMWETRDVNHRKNSNSIRTESGCSVKFCFECNFNSELVSKEQKSLCAMNARRKAIPMTHHSIF